MSRFDPGCARLLVAQIIADLGLERNSNVERGLVVWSAVVVGFALLTLTLAMRRSGRLRISDSKAADAIRGDRGQGWPFMKRALLGAAQVLGGVTVVYILAQLLTPRIERPLGWHLVTPPHEAGALALRKGIVWVGGREGLFSFDRRTLASADIAELKSRDLRGVRSLLAEGEALWIACKQGLFRLHDQKLERIAPRDDRDLGPVSAIYRASDRALWIGVRGGAWRIDAANNEWRWFGRSDGLVLPGVDVIYEDRGGNLWLGSSDPEATGLFRAKGNWKFVDQSDGLTSLAVNHMREDRAGNLWVATGFGGRGAAARLEENGWVLLEDLPGLKGEKIRSLFEDSRGRFWYCSEYNGVAIRAGDEWHRITLKDGLPGTEVKAMLEDDDGTFWLATERGLGCLRQLQWPESR
jgi:hypothetical protein